MHALALRALTGTLQGMVLAPDSLTNLNAKELREMVTQLMAQVGENAKTIVSKDREILYRQTKIDQLTHEMVVLKRWKFGRSRKQLDAGQLGRQRCASGQLTWRSVDDWRGRQMFEFFFNGCDVGINGLVEQAGLCRVKLLTAPAELPAL